MYRTHGDTGTRLYKIWQSMKCRCNNSNHPTYKRYGGRGIKACKEWNDSYQVFKEWALFHGYNENLELERIDVNGGYNPSNCTWITHHEQTLNRRDTLYITIDGNCYKLRTFCDENGINKNTVNGWRHLNILEEKLEGILGKHVLITGGKKEVMI